MGWTPPPTRTFGTTKANDFAITTKDGDYPNLVALRGHPPKVVWLRLGNCTTRQVADALRANHPAVEAFGADPSIGTIEIR